MFDNEGGAGPCQGIPFVCTAREDNQKSDQGSDAAAKQKAKKDAARHAQRIQAGILPKHIAAVHVGGEINLLQRRVFNVLLFLAYEKLLDRDVHIVDLTSIRDVLGYSSRNIKKLVDTAESLKQVPISWDILGKDDENNDISIRGSGHLLADSQVTTYKGRKYLEYSFGGNAKRLFYNPKLYALIGLDLQQEFKSKYALALYENCARFKGVGSTGWIGLDTFRDLMGCGGTRTLRVFAKLKAKVVEPAVKEINALERGEFFVDYDVKREGQVPVAIKFLIEAKHSHSTSARELETTLKDHCRLSQTQIDKILQEHQEEYIKHVLDRVQEYTDGKVEAGQKVNVAAFTVAAFDKGYFPLEEGKPGAIVEAEAKSSSHRRKKTMEKTLSLLETDRKKAERDHAQGESQKAAYAALRAEKRASLEREFEEEVVGTGVLRKPFEEGGVMAMVVWPRFKAFLDNKGVDL